jgi:two-component system, LytTR family, sensor kinase
MDFDPVCVDDGRTVVHRAGDRAGESSRRARQLGVRCDRIRLLVRMGGVHTACDWSSQAVPVDGAEVCNSYSDPHNHVAPDGSPGICHRILSERWTSAVTFSHTDPGALRLLPTFTVSVLSMSFTGVLTYWLVVGLYQSIHFYQAAMERQTIAAQLETQLSHAELENLKSQLHPHFLFNSLHTIGVLMQEDVDAASHLLVSLGDLLRMALERRENEITLQSELEFVGKYLEIEQTRFHDRLKVHMDVPPDLLGVYVPSLALQPLVENAIKHGISVDSAAGRLEIAAQRHNGRVWLCVRDDGPGPAPGSRLRFGVGLTNVQSRLKQLYGDESSLELTGGDGRGCEAIITIPLRSSLEDASPHRR